jgi:hypothetical protein
VGSDEERTGGIEMNRRMAWAISTLAAVSLGALVLGFGATAGQFGLGGVTDSQADTVSTSAQLAGGAQTDAVSLESTVSDKAAAFETEKDEAYEDEGDDDEGEHEGDEHEDHEEHERDEHEHEEGEND